MNHNKKELVIVILNWNGSDMLKKYLPSVSKYSEGAEIIIADNASTDDSIEFLKKEFPNIRVIALEQNWGFADGYNKALAQIEANYYLLLNNDVRVESGWLDAMIRYMKENDDVAACQPKLLSDTEPTMFEYAGACGGFIDNFGYPYCRGRIFNTTEIDKGQYDTVIDILWATGACLLIRSEDYWKAGGFDGRFFAHNEEIDLCWRLNIMGRRIVCIPQSKVYHLGGGTLPKSNPHKTYLNFRNNLTMLYKNLPENSLRHVMRVRSFLDYIAAIQMLLQEHSLGNFKAIIKARKDFHKWKKDFRQDRTNIQRYRNDTIIRVKASLCILWQYHFRRRKTFNKLPS